MNDYIARQARMSGIVAGVRFMCAVIAERRGVQGRCNM
jgi:hypothetical protein